MTVPDGQGLFKSANRTATFFSDRSRTEETKKKKEKAGVVRTIQTYGRQCSSGFDIQQANNYGDP
jgi:hypothetical protein